MVYAVSAWPEDGSKVGIDWPENPGWEKGNGQHPRMLGEYRNRISRRVFGAHVPEDYLPSRILFRPGRRRAVDLIYVSYGTMVSQEFRDVVERFEPETHQFHPLDCRDETGKVSLDRPFYLFFPGQAFDAVILGTEEDGGAYVGPYPGGESIGVQQGRFLVFSGPRIGTRHLWSGIFVALPGDFFVSNELGAAFEKAGLKNICYKPQFAEPYEETDDIPDYANDPEMAKVIEVRRSIGTLPVNYDAEW